MDFIAKLFKKKKQQQPQTGVTDMAKAIGPLLDKAANDIFLQHRNTLLAEPITYIVPAVWGAAKDAKLTSEQIQINQKLLPIFQEVFAILRTEAFNESQKFALGFLVRGLIISKITYMIEALKNKLTAMEAKERSVLIRDLEPIGHA